MRFETRGGREIAIKDCSESPWLMRVLFCRPALRREARIYLALCETEGVPECLGFEGPDRLLLARAPGRPLPMWPAEEVPAGTADQLKATIHRIHARGVAIADLHRSNVLVSEDSKVHVIDYALARVSRTPERARMLVRWLQILDNHALARICARLNGLPEPQPRGIFGIAYRTGRTIKRHLL